MNNRKYLILSFSFLLLVIIITIFFKYKNSKNIYATIIDNDKVVEKILIEGNHLKKMPREYKKEGHTFLGYYLNDEIFDLNSTINSNITLYTKYKINTYKVTYDFSNEGKYYTTYVEYNNLIPKMKTDEIIGYDFNGWYINNNIVDFDTYKVKNDTYLKARYTIKSFNVTLDPNNDNDIISLKINYNDIIPKPENPTKNGFTFKGWYYKKDNKEYKYDFNNKVTEDIELYAKFDVHNIYGDLNQDGIVSIEDANVLLEYLRGNIEFNNNQIKINADVDLDNCISFNDYVSIKKHINNPNYVLGTKTIQVKNIIPGDYNFDNKINIDDVNDFKTTYLDHNKCTPSYMKKLMDLNNDNKINNNDYKKLKNLEKYNFNLLDINTLSSFKEINNINRSYEYVVHKKEVTINNVKFNAFYVFNIKTFDDFDNLYTFSDRAFNQLKKVSNNVLKLINKNGSNYIFFGSYDCDEALKNDTKYTYAGYCNSINRYVVIGYDLGRLDSSYYQAAIIHETGHALDFTIGYTFSNIEKIGYTKFEVDYINNGSNNLKKVFLFDSNNNPYTWKYLANMDASNLKVNFKSSSFSYYSSNDLIKRPHEFYAEFFKHYYYSTTERNELKNLAPITFSAFEKTINNLNYVTK